MAEIPNYTNFFSSLTTTLTQVQVAALYGAKGWQVRKCSWEDYEVRTDWAELVIESENPMLVHGQVADVQLRAEELVGPLREAGISFSAECYGPNDELLLELSSTTSN